MRPSKRRKLANNSDLAKAEKIKAQVLAKVERRFLTVKRIFAYSKVRYRGLAKNAERLHLLAGFTNLLKSKDYLLA